MRKVFADLRNDLEGTYSCKEAREEDFPRHILEDCYDIEIMMGILANYFDYKAYAR